MFQSIHYIDDSLSVEYKTVTTWKGNRYNKTVLSYDLLSSWPDRLIERFGNGIENRKP